ncbi:ApbE family lipoprotein [Crenothrix polyspora]|uniref:FAD:protein FMN transferase n=1 Tax=Crenothrix polyspora TaxID=360316 RepID=A0A1R4HCM7_9GAMM|nr:FAD:protein FMN transferase [Crenothrix polyspora]SJM93982.1 ApbE family lipoprotein [Crenothrix polyspora]
MKTTTLNKYPLNLTSIILLTLITSGCVKPEDIQKLSGSAQGTSYHISFSSKKDIDLKTIAKSVEAEFSRIDKQLSNYRPDSAIEQFNASLSDQPQTVDAEIVSLIEQARSVSIASHGCYDLTIKPLFELWGFTKDELTPPDEKTIKTILHNVGLAQLEHLDANHLRKHNPDLKVDLSSIGQGYSVSRITGLLEQQGIKDYMVEIGGELQTRGQKPDGQPWRIALEKPLSGERTLHKIITINRTTPLAIMTSGTYRHYFDVDGKRYSHILDARTGKPVTHTTVSVSVLHDDPTLADAWSTALLCLGKNAGIEAANKAGVAALFIEQQDEAFNEYASDSLAKLEQVSIK